MNAFSLVAAIMFLVAGSAFAGKPGHGSGNGNNHKNSGHHHKHHSNHNFHGYHLTHGKSFGFGFCYPGKTHSHWASQYYDSSYGHTFYWCPSTLAYYYWDQSAGAYYPQSYLTGGRIQVVTIFK